MRPGKHKESAGAKQLGSDDFDIRKEADLKEFEASSAYYERRSRIRMKWHKGDSWIAVGLYLVLVSVAFVIL